MLASTRSVESTAAAVQLALCGSIPITTPPDTMVLLVSPIVGDEEGTPTFSPTGLSQATPRPAVAGTQALQKPARRRQVPIERPRPPPRRSWLQTPISYHPSNKSVPVQRHVICPGFGTVIFSV